jgi:glucose/arabinose dehydrogenase
MHRSLRTVLLLTATCCIAAASTQVATSTAASRGTTAAPSVRLAPLANLSFTSPVWVGGAGDGTSNLYVVEQGGIVWRVAGGRRSVFLDVRRSIMSSGEQGLLSLAFARDFRTSGRIFVYFTAAGTGNGQVRQFLVRDGRVVSGSGRVIIDVPLAPPTATNHNGGNLWPGPGGQLYLSIGDGGAGGDPNNNAQNLGRLMGKLLRIAPKLRGGYLIPNSNPYVGRRGARAEIYALGLRNPWRFSIDGATGDIWIGDVGQDAREEIDRLRGGRPAGANFGWRRMEGTQVFEAGTRLTAGTPYVAPFRDYGRDGGECSVTGGVVYRGPVTALRGWYLYADYCTDDLHLLFPGDGTHAVRVGDDGIVHFGAGPGGNVYAASQMTGRIYRVVAA